MRDRPSASSRNEEGKTAATAATTLPLESGWALAVSFLRSAIGIATGRPGAAVITTPATLTFASHTGDNNNDDDEFERHWANLHNKLSQLLLEGVMAERPENDETKDTLLREFLKWPLAKLRTEQFMTSLPPSFCKDALWYKEEWAVTKMRCGSCLAI
jgi:hypothetical protein